MSLYSTPLQFGYFFSLLMALIFWYRAYREERLSDTMLGWVMLILAMELQDYTFGFSGINFLWNEMNGFPRGVALLFGPAIYFYIQSQTNRNFKLRRKHALHLIPWAVYFIIQLVVFVQGKDAVSNFQSSKLSYWLGILNYVARLVSFAFYFYLSISLYLRYRKWSKNQFSNVEVISFKWFRNFIYLMIVWTLFREVMFVIDGALDLNFYQDWWWNLALAATAFYVGIQGYGQNQPKLIAFEDDMSIPVETKDVSVKEETAYDLLAKSLQKRMEQDRLYLHSELSLSELAQHLKVNSREISACINQVFKLNFNDYINSWRIQAFEEKIKDKANRQFTLLSIAYECGFNSKATFNRAFKKLKGTSPKEYVNKVEAQD